MVRLKKLFGFLIRQHFDFLVRSLVYITFKTVQIGRSGCPDSAVAQVDFARR